MAGDWIKLEHATAFKPEITIGAEWLGISRREMLGLIFDYWIWLDQNIEDSRNGLVTHVSRKSLEQTLQCPGFASVLEGLQWATFDDEHRSMQVIHWDRHNGNTAKSRALSKDRQSRHRNSRVTLTPLPEKRREEKSNTTPKTKATVAALPEWLDEKLWQQFKDARRAGRAPITPHAENLLLAKLGKLRAAGNEPALVVEQSIERGWRGLFPLEVAKVAGQPVNAWWTSEAGTLAKASEFGLSSRGGESWFDFRGRIREAMANQREPKHGAA